MPVRSAGLLVYRLSGSGVVEVLIAHPGGPFWARKDEGAWSIPKGEHGEGDDPLTAAFREFREETGQAPPDSTPIPLGELVQPSRKRVNAWALEGDVDVTHVTSNTFVMEWPKGSGRMREFPEVDRVEWATLATARTKLLKGQVPFLDRLMEDIRARHNAVEEAESRGGS